MPQGFKLEDLSDGFARPRFMLQESKGEILLAERAEQRTVSAADRKRMADAMKALGGQEGPGKQSESNS
jgi:hypothetical protein